MNNFPKGNDLIVKWAIKYSDGTPFPLENYAWELCYSAGRGINVVKDTAVISVSDNLLTWRFSGKDQAFYGKYSLTLRLYQQGKIVATVSKNNAFELSTTQYDGPCDIDLVSYCDNISLQDALLRGNRAMEVAQGAKDIAGSAVNTAAGAVTTANEAKKIASTANSTSTEAKTIASNAKTVADQAKVTADTTAATATQKAEEVAQKEAQLEAALNNLSTDQSGALALSTKVNEHGEKLSELESEINGESKKTITPNVGPNTIAEIDVNEGDTINISAIASTPLTVAAYILLYMNEEIIYRSKLISTSSTQGSIIPFNVTIAGKVIIKFEYNENTPNTIDFIISPAKKGVFDLINDLTDSLANTKTSIGELSDLTTENKDSIVSSINEINAIAGKTTRHLTDEEIISGSFRVIPDGELAGHSQYSYTRPIEVYTGDTVKLIGACGTNICVITKVDAENNPIKVLLVGQGPDVSEYEYIVESDGYISISCLSMIISTVTISHSNLPKYELPIDNIDRLLKVTENPLEYITRERGYGAIIREWGFIGDSYSSGATPAKDSSGSLFMDMDIYPISWGQQFVRLIGANGYNFSNGGQTAKGWLRSQGTKHDSSYIGGEGGGDWRHAQLDKKQAYFISLGINDNGRINRWEQEGTQYLGDAYTLGNVETDIDLNNYTNNNENTFVGCYAGIIQRLLSIQPKAKIFVVTQFQPALDHINNAIRSIASKFNNVFIVDLRMYAPNITDNMQYYMKNGHPTPYGYMYMAYMINTYVDWIIRNNKDKFMDVTLIGTDYSL